MASKYPGKLIVIDGTDSSGKSTQFELFKTHLQQEGHNVFTIKYPRKFSEAGKIIYRILYGEFGPIESISPEYISLLYSADRYEELATIKMMLEKGFIVLADRYCQSNFAYQSAKFLDPKKRAEFLTWQREVDSRMPKPDAVIFLDMPPKAGQQLLSVRSQSGQPIDLHEKDVEYQSRVLAMYQQLSKSEKWIHILCAKPVGASWNVSSRESIAEQVWNAVSKKFKWKTSQKPN